MASWVVSAPLRKIWVRSSKPTFHRPPPKTVIVIWLRMWSTLLTTPPTRVVLPSGIGGGSRMGSCPSVASTPPEVAELSRITVLGRCSSSAAAEPVLSTGAAGCGGPTFLGFAELLVWVLVELDCAQAQAANSSTHDKVMNGERT